MALSERARRLWAEAIVVDGHNDLPTRILDGYDADVRHLPGYPPDHGDTDVPRLVESGITAQFLVAFVEGKYARQTPDHSFARAIAGIDAIHALIARHPETLVRATSAADVERAKARGTVAILTGVEGGHAIENSLDKLRALHARGARCMTLVWNNGNDWAGSSIGESQTNTGGLTPFGIEVVREMNRLGMLVDLSHVSDATFFDAVQASRQPVIASHSNARRLASVPRNLNDDQLRAIAESEGIVGVNFFAAFLDAAFYDAMTRLEREAEHSGATEAGGARHDPAVRAEVRALPVPPLTAIADHLDHMVAVAGVDHVALGSDFDGVGGLLPAGMADVTQLGVLVDVLIGRSYDDAAILKILGGNLLRVMRRVLDGK